MASHSQSLPPGRHADDQGDEQEGRHDEQHIQQPHAHALEPAFEERHGRAHQAAMIVVPMELKIPMVSERPRPRIIIAYISEPPTVVPSQCWADGGEARAAKSGSS